MEIFKKIIESASPNAQVGVLFYVAGKSMEMFLRKYRPGGRRIPRHMNGSMIEWIKDLLGFGRLLALLGPERIWP